MFRLVMIGWGRFQDQTDLGDPARLLRHFKGQDQLPLAPQWVINMVDTDKADKADVDTSTSSTQVFAARPVTQARLKSSEVLNCPELSRVSILTWGDFGWLPCMWPFGSRCLMLKCVRTADARLVKCVRTADAKLVQSSIASTKCSCVCLDSPETI